MFGSRTAIQAASVDTFLSSLSCLMNDGCHLKPGPRSVFDERFERLHIERVKCCDGVASRQGACICACKKCRGRSKSCTVPFRYVLLCESVGQLARNWWLGDMQKCICCFQLKRAMLTGLVPLKIDGTQAMDRSRARSLQSRGDHHTFLL